MAQLVFVLAVAACLKTPASVGPEASARGKTPVSVATPDGQVDGLSNGTTNRFLGIPFAEAPVGDLRFAAPKPITPWTEPFDATFARPPCAQIRIKKRDMRKESREDCLTLNVWAPSEGDGPHPVLVFLYGGAYVYGDAALDMYDGTQLSRAGEVVLVTANYRVGPLGFFAHPALEALGGETGNQGLLDQQEALRWITRNIAAFGGDPHNVTLFGQSAGAGSACLQLGAPGAAGLFHRLVLESAPCTALPLVTAESRKAQGIDLGEALGCTGDDAQVLDCLRAAPVEEVVEALPLHEHVIFGDGVGWMPTADGVVLPDPPATFLAAGAFRSVPLIVGSNEDEGTVFVPKKSTVRSRSDFESLVRSVFDVAEADALLLHYTPSDDPREDATEFLSDLWTCDARRIASLHTAAGGTAFHYHFTANVYLANTRLGAFHASELPFVFGNGLGRFRPKPAGLPLQRAMQSYWTSFGRTGVPEGPVAWPPYDPDHDESLRLDLEIGLVSRVEQADCDAWDRILESR